MLVGELCTELTRMPSSSWQSLARRPVKPRSASSTNAKSDYETTTVDKRKKARLERKGWKIGDVAEFLDLTNEESAYIEMKLALSEKLRARRARVKMTQEELARLIRSSQSRVAKMEAGDPTVSIDLLVKSLLALGVSKKELGRAIS
jgi:DNA-binding XRE family transcriptional regulator